MLTPPSTSPRLFLPKPPPHGGAGDPKDALRSATGRIQTMRPGRGTFQPRARQLTPSADWNGSACRPYLDFGRPRVAGPAASAAEAASSPTAPVVAGVARPPPAALLRGPAAVPQCVSL